MLKHDKKWIEQHISSNRQNKYSGLAMGAEMHWPKSRVEWIILFLCIAFAAVLIGLAYLRLIA